MSNNPTPSAIESTLGTPRHVEPIDGFTVDYYLDDHIVAYHGDKIGRDVTDAFISVGDAYINSCKAANRPIFYFYVVGAFAITPYTKHHIDAFIERHKDIRGYGAYLFLPSPYRLIVQNFVMVGNRRGWRNVDFRAVKSEEEGLLWLYDRYLAWQATQNPPAD